MHANLQTHTKIVLPFFFLFFSPVCGSYITAMTSPCLGFTSGQKHRRKKTDLVTKEKSVCWTTCFCLFASYQRTRTTKTTPPLRPPV